MASTNLVGVFSIYKLFMVGKYARATSLLTSMIFSFIYHLCESIKHDMPGIGVSESTERKLLSLDRLAAYSSIMVAIVDGVEIFRIKILIALLCLFISEVVSIKFSMEKAIYMLFHSLWHIIIFISAV